MVGASTIRAGRQPEGPQERDFSYLEAPAYEPGVRSDVTVSRSSRGYGGSPARREWVADQRRSEIVDRDDGGGLA